MPTGYTAPVATGEISDFRTFVLRCARAFGACVMQRDDAIDALPEHRKESPYHPQQIDRLMTKLGELDQMTPEQAEEAADQAYRERVAEVERGNRERNEQRDRYEAMLARVQAGEPPTSEHEGLKRFMIEQLQESIRFDTTYETTLPERRAGAAWKMQQIEDTLRSLSYHYKQREEERTRVREANEWIDALYASVEPQSC